MENTVVIAMAGSGTKAHKAYHQFAGTSADCMNNSLNGRIHTVLFRTEKVMTENGYTKYTETDALLTAWLDQHPEVQPCGRCFKGYKREGVAA